jgi:hypothetical protein
MIYHIAGNFHGVQFSRMASFLFADVCNHTHYTLYNRAYFVGLIFTDSHLSTKIGPLKNFLLYGTSVLARNFL